MSLQRYLFLLIGVLILVFSAIQYYFIEQVRVQVNDEITNKTRTISQVALTEFSERMHLPHSNSQQHISNIEEIRALTGEPSDTIRIKIESTPNKEITLDEDLVMVTGSNTRTVTVNTKPPNTTSKEAKLLTGLLVNRVNAAYTLDFDFEGQEQDFQKIISFDSQHSTVNRYFSQLRWQLLGFTIVGLVFAYCLARHIAKPLSKLSQGFVDLGNGALGTQLEQSGVKEMRNTIAKFNQTSERLNQLQQLEKSFQQQQQMAELGEVARGLAHTLRNPLNTIGLGISQIQSGNISDAEQSVIAKQIQDKITHLDGTIKTLMHLANNELERSTPLNLVSVVSDIMLEVSVTNQAQIEFPVAKTETPIFLQGAEAEIRAIIHALISNAIEANKGQSHSVHVDLQTINNGVQLKVKDYGEGLDMSNCEHIFKPHFTTKSEGAGMGLFIVKRISEMYYQGNIALSNVDGGGCEAILTLQHASEQTSKMSNTSNE